MTTKSTTTKVDTLSLTEVKSSYWDKEYTLPEIPTDGSNVMKVSLTEKKGKRWLVFREWYCSKFDPEYRPGKHGGAIPLEAAEDFAGSIMVAVNAARELGWLK